MRKRSTTTTTESSFVVDDCYKFNCSGVCNVGGAYLAFASVVDPSFSSPPVTLLYRSAGPSQAVGRLHSLTHSLHRRAHVEKTNESFFSIMRNGGRSNKFHRIENCGHLYVLPKMDRMSCRSLSGSLIEFYHVSPNDEMQ